MRRILLIAVLVTLVPGIAAARTGHRKNPGQGTTLELYAQTTDAAINLSNPPQPGEMAAFGRDLFLLGGTPEAPEPVGDPIGRNLVLCTLVTMTEASCDGQWFLDEIGLISGSSYLDLTSPPGSGFAAALIGGSGAFKGANGTIRNLPVPGTEDQVWIVEVMGRNER